MQRYLRRRASTHDADDAYSETLATVWRRLDDVPEGAPLPWVYGVARRVLSNQRRSARRHMALVDRTAAMASEPVQNDPAEADGFPEVRDALRMLSESDQEVLTLWAWEELEPREIAAVLDVTANTVSLRLGRAKQRLAEELERQNRLRVGQIHDENGRSRTDDR